MSKKQLVSGICNGIINGTVIGVSLAYLTEKMVVLPTGNAIFTAVLIYALIIAFGVKYFVIPLLNE